MELWTQVKELQAIGIKDIIKSSDLKKKYIKLYKALFLQNMCVSCNSTISHSFDQFLKLTSKQTIIMKNRKFLFKDSTTLWIEERQEHLTNANLTDELALDLLRKNKGYAKYFDIIPENWQELIKEPAPAKPAATAVQPSDPSDAKSAIELALEQMDVRQLRTYTEERKTQFPKWATYKKRKATLLKYILKNL